MRSYLLLLRPLLALCCVHRHVFAFVPPSSTGVHELRIHVSAPSPLIAKILVHAPASSQHGHRIINSPLHAAAKPCASETISAIAAVPPTMQLILTISSVLIIASYHINLIIKERTSRVKTWRAYQAETREDWARHVRNTEGWLYAVQTLRNAITAQTFLATTVLSLLTLITGKLWDILRHLDRGSERRLLTVQLLSVALTMLMSAYQFLQGVRLMTHAGFMFPVSEGTKVDNIMRRSQNCQWLGLRWMYISLAPIAWAVGGSRALFGVSCCLLQFFRNIDRKPKGMGYEEFQGGGI